MALQDTELLDSSVYRSKANLGRKRRHRAPALRPGAASEGDSWMFRDSTGESPPGMVTTGEGPRGHLSPAEVPHGDAVPLPAEPRPARPAVSSDEEAAEEPKSRRVRASPSSKGVKVPLFPGLSTSALKVGPTGTLSEGGGRERKLRQNGTGGLAKGREGWGAGGGRIWEGAEQPVPA